LINYALRDKQLLFQVLFMKTKKVNLSRNKLSLALALSLGISQAVQAQFPNPIQLSDLNGNNGFVIQGANAGDQSGESVSAAGDINGDGIDDVIIGADGANSFAGSSYVVFGQEQPIFKDGFE